MIRKVNSLVLIWNCSVSRPCIFSRARAPCAFPRYAIDRQLPRLLRHRYIGWDNGFVRCYFLPLSPLRFLNTFERTTTPSIGAHAYHCHPGYSTMPRKCFSRWAHRRCVNIRVRRRRHIPSTSIYFLIKKPLCIFVARFANNALAFKPVFVWILRIVIWTMTFFK